MLKVIAGNGHQTSGELSHTKKKWDLFVAMHLLQELQKYFTLCGLWQKDFRFFSHLTSNIWTVKHIARHADNYRISIFSYSPFISGSKQSILILRYSSHVDMLRDGE